MDLLKLDINQCPDPYYATNAFEGTEKCDHKTSYVSTKSITSSEMITDPDFISFSVFLYKDEVLRRVVTNASANRGTSIPSKIQ